MKQRVISRIATMLGLLVVLCAVLSGPVSAQESGSEVGELRLTTNPLPISLVGRPGETVRTKVEVKNGGTAPEKLKVGLMKFSAYGEEGKPELKDREAGDDYFDWVTFSENQFTVEPDTWYAVDMTIQLPAEAAFGYYYAVTFSRQNLPVTGDSNLLQGGTAVLVLVEAQVDNARREIVIDEFSASKKIYEFMPAEFKVKVHNTGNIHLPAKGSIYIKQGDKTVGMLDVNKAGGNILPSSKRVFTTKWPDGFPAYVPVESNGQVELKDGEQVYKLKWDLSKITDLRIGKYTAELVMTYDNGTRDAVLEATLTFWVIPWRLLAGLLVPLLLVVVLILKYLKLRRRMKNLEDKKSA